MCSKINPRSEQLICILRLHGIIIPLPNLFLELCVIALNMRKFVREFCEGDKITSIFVGSDAGACSGKELR